MTLPDGDLEPGLLLRNLLDSDPQGLFFTDVEGRIVRASRAWPTRSGWTTPRALSGTLLREYLDGELAAHFTADHQSIVATGVPVVELHERWRTPAGRTPGSPPSRHPLLDDDGRVTGTFGVLHDITAHKRMEALLQQPGGRAGAGRTPSCAGRRTTCARCWRPPPTRPSGSTAASGWSTPTRPPPSCTARAPGEMLDLSVYELAEASNALNLLEPFELGHAPGAGDRPARGARGRGRWSTAPMYLHTRIVPEHDRMGTVSGLLLVTRDLTARKRVEDLLAERALRDPLTGLANRALLTDRLEQALVRLERTKGELAVLFLDLDHFKVVNDSLGHAAGDALLAEVAAPDARLGPAQRHDRPVRRRRVRHPVRERAGLAAVLPSRSGS